ncbi:LacI family DNA-binding transcriptional regulator [Anaeropeptidivorans aminofermentans]|jgi:LacI family transcriptional regulator|uniref:LacI family DNA-binding transcriptional regulator n=1 Tax=Anaeropeptidivorans aminofermentans TaxID=2934315 RepID=UPI002023D07F|nr:LacI family DNA-binding transcriptional regulator [Anaeropeptidivorans aminofermentans]
MSKANMRDVAEHAKVSVATVSHVINNTRFVADETKKRVLKSIEELDYIPDAMARIFKTGKKNLIGFVVPDIANAFFATIIEEIENVISTQNYRLIVVNTKETESREAEHIRALSSGIVDGLIIASTMKDFDQIKSALSTDIPLVFIDRELPGCNCDTITISNYDSIFQGIQTLVMSGHTKIGYIAGLMRLSTTEERLSAYKDAMKHFGLPLEENFIQYGDSMSQSAIPSLLKLLDMKCTAVIASNNVMSDDVIYYLSDKDIKIGKDLEIIGYNDTGHENYQMRKVHMVSQPVKEMGRLAGKQILKRICLLEDSPKNIILQSAFVPRNN